jgi:hypothetical protein
MSDQDEVVQEGNIYLSNDLLNSLHLLQFTTLNQYTEAKVKPQQLKLQLNYRFDNNVIHLESTHKPMNAKYCVGVFDEDMDLVLHNIESIMELKPKLVIADENVEEEKIEMKSLHLQTTPEINEDWVDLTLLRSKLELDFTQQELHHTTPLLDEMMSDKKDGYTDVNQKLLDVFMKAHVLNADTRIAPMTTLLPILKNLAVCIRGVWILKSEFLYSGRPLDARNYLLSLFAENEYIQRLEFSDTCGLPNEVSQNMLEEIAVLDRGLGWCLKLPADPEFMKKNAKMIEDQLKELQELGKKYGSLM